VSAPDAALLAATAASVAGMMLVVAGVVVSGLFLAGPVLLGLGMLGYAAAAVLHARAGSQDAAAGGGRARSARR
jgi:hypothetical protein